MLKVLVIAVILVSSIAAGFSFLNQNLNANISPSPSPVLQPVSETYFGVLPCADCSGLETTLILNKVSPDATSGTFKEILNYQGKSVEPYETSGSFKIETGIKDYPNAQVVALNPDNPDQVEYYLQTDANTLLTLDKQKQKIDAPFNMSLKKQQ